MTKVEDIYKIELTPNMRVNSMRAFLKRFEGHNEALAWLMDFEGYRKANPLSLKTKALFAAQDGNKSLFQDHENFIPNADLQEYAKCAIWKNMETGQMKISVGRFGKVSDLPERGPSMRLGLICAFFREFSDAKKPENSAILAWIFDAEFRRTMSDSPAPAEVRASIMKVDPHNQLVTNDGKLTPHDDVEAVGYRTIIYNGAKRSAVLDVAELQSVAEGKPGKHEKKLLDMAERNKIDPTMATTIQAIPEERREKVMDFLKGLKRNRDTLKWLLNHEGVRTSADKVPEEISDDITQMDSEFEIVSNDGKLTPQPDAKLIIDIVIVPNKRSGTPALNERALNKYLRFGQENAGRED